MAISNKKKKQISRNYPAKSAPELAKELGLSVKEVEQALKEMGLQPPTKKPAGEKPAERKKTFPVDLVIALAIALVALGLYLGALPNGFVMDDYKLILKNPSVQGEEGLGKIFQSQFADGIGKQSPFYRPVIIFSYALDHRFWKDHPRGYHLTNVIVHCLASVLIFLCFSLWSRGYPLLKDSSRAIGAFAGLLFAVHPAHTQSVTWIAGRTDIFSTFFCLLAFYLFLHSRNLTLKLELSLIICSLLSFFLALLAKEVAVVFPLLLILADYTQERELRSIFKPRQIIIYSAFFGLVIVYLLIRQEVLGFPFGSGKLVSNWHSDWKAEVSGLVTVFKIFFYYLKTLLFPAQLCFECRLGPSLSWADPQIYYSIIIIALLLASGVFALSRLPWLGLCIFWFFLPLLPVSNLTQQIGIKELAMEHYLYLPSIGFCLALAIVVAKTREKLGGKYQALGKGSVLALFAGILLFYAALTWQRNPDWKNNKTIWRDAVNKAPTRKRSLQNLADEYVQQGNKRQAMFYFRLATRLIPSDADSHYNLGVALGQLGHQDEAVREYQEAIRLNPGRANAHNNLGSALQGRNDWEGAVREYREAVNLDPKYLLAWQNLANAYLELGRCDQARQARNQLGNKADPGLVQKLQQKCPE